MNLRETLLDFLKETRQSVQMNAATAHKVEDLLIHWYYPVLVVLFIALVAALLINWRTLQKYARDIPRGSGMVLLAIFIGSLVFRFVFLGHHPQVFYDETLFIETAQSFSQHGINLRYNQLQEPSCFMVCTAGWPFLVAMAFKLTGSENVRVAFGLSALLSAFTVFWVFYFVRIFFDSPRAGLWAAAMFSLHPVIARLSTSSAMGTSSLFFLFMTLTFMAVYHREEKPSLLYLAFLSLSYTVNVRQEAFIVLAPLLLLFFFLFHRNLKRELKNPHFYGALLIFVLFYLPAAMVSLYGISTGYYYFYESPVSMRNHIISNLQKNVTFWISNRIQPLFFTILAVLGGWILWQKNRRAAWFFGSWFLFMQLFYSINPSCEFSSIRTIDSWRNSAHQNAALVAVAGLAPPFLVDYFKKNRPRIAPFITLLLIVAMLVVPFRFEPFINYKSIWAREYLFLEKHSHEMNPRAIIVADRGTRKAWFSFFSHLQYGMAVPMVGYQHFDPVKLFSRRAMIRDLRRWIYKEDRPVYLYLSVINDSNFDGKLRWYQQNFILEPVDGYSHGKLLVGFMLYRLRGIRERPQHREIR